MIFQNSYANIIVISSIISLVLMSIGFTLMAYIYMIYPDKLLKFGLKLARSFAGMSKVHRIPRKTGSGIWCYAEKGTKLSNGLSKETLLKSKTLVFLHGFGADKDMWPSIVKKMPSNYHCVIVDLPGHGETTFQSENDTPSIEGYARSLHEFFEMSGLDSKKVILIGCSFGGAVASLFCYYHPECVENLILLCPAVKTPILTKTCQDLFDGNYQILIPDTGEKFVSMIQLLTYHKRFYPANLMQSFVNMNFDTKRQELLKKILDSIVNIDLKQFDSELENKIGQIKHKTLIIWGKDDELLHFSGAELLSQTIVNSELKILEKCNHVMHIDQPNLTTSHILTFIKNQNN